MKCPKCQFENREGVSFCEECGAQFKSTCPNCKAKIPLRRKFCGQCGHDLREPVEAVSRKESEPGTHISEPPIGETISTESAPEGERKHVTVLFSDLTGYTAMSEKLDPEELKEITQQIFSEISKIVSNYDGFIEKYAGDAVMAIFGVPKSHEDDPMRAVKVAKKIHELVEAMSPEVEKKIGQSISMHTGINTGLVVTGEVDMKRGTHGIAGDTINLASRLSSLARAGEILVNADTYRQVEGQFICEYRETTTVKGKADPVKVYQVFSQRDKPLTIHRLSGLKADLIGRDVEMAELSEAIENLRQGKGRIFSICGAAGTGKSRLVEEFKTSLDLERIQWIEGHAYAYSQNIPYFPLVDLLSRLLQIDEKDSPSEIREKIGFRLGSLITNQEDVIPYVGQLYSLSYPQTTDISPEHWKSRLQTAVMKILSVLAAKSPTVFFLEDLHWADPSFVELLRRACMEIRQPAIVLCTYRPTFSLFTGHQVSTVGNIYHDIQLQNLSLSVAQNMLASLLEAEAIPTDLKRWVNDKAEGNPFYIEELVNSLIETRTLVLDHGVWKLTRSLTESDIPSSLHGLISGRLDRLERQTKRVLQEASVIGRDFLYDILKKITEIEERVDAELIHLERSDLIRPRSFHPEIEYMFKHALTQEIVYNGLLNKQRRKIHEHVAQVMEIVFQNRLSEIYETLAHHYTRGESHTKAIDYLIKSGEKSLARYAVEEAHQYFKNAYDILMSKEELSEEDKVILIDILNSWGYVYYYIGENKEFVDLFNTHKALAESLEDKAKTAMFCVWLGVALFMAGKSKDSYKNLYKGLELGESVGCRKAVGYACTWLIWACAELGLFDEGTTFGERAQKIAESFPSDQYLFFKSLGGLCFINFLKGDTKRIFEDANRLLEYGEKHTNNRSKVLGHWMKAFGHQAAGDMESAIKYSETAIQSALDPAYAQFPKSTLGMAYFYHGQPQEAEKIFQSALNFCVRRGLGQMYVMCRLFLSPIVIAKGNMKQGIELLEKAQEILLRNQRRVWYALSEHILGAVNSQIATGPKPSLSTMAKNVGFLIKNVPIANKKAEEHFTKAIALFQEIGARRLLAQSHLSLGLLYKANKRTDQARQCILEAINIFSECEAEVYLGQAKEALDSLL